MSKRPRKLPPMPPVEPREPFGLDGYMESLNDWVGHNREAVEWFLENADAIRAALFPPVIDTKPVTRQPTAPVDRRKKKS